MRICSLSILLACGPHKQPDDPTTAAGSETGSAAATGDSPTSSTTADPPTSSPATSEPSTGSEALCDTFCAKLIACDLDGGFDGCPCLDDPEAGPKCLALWQQTVACFDAATCEALAADDSQCWMVFMSAYERCLFGEDGCEIYTQIGGPHDGTCTFGEECIDAPTKEVTCDATLCTCTIEGKQIGTCPAENVCDTLEDLDARIAACCNGMP